MAEADKLIAAYEILLKTLEDDGLTERWQVYCRMVNAQLRLSIANMDYLDMLSGPGSASQFSEEYRDKFEIAIEHRRALYQRRNVMGK